MKMKIKLRDITPEQWDRFEADVCGNDVKCDGIHCPFRYASCGKSSDKDSWVNNKDMFSDKFLDQEIEIEVEPTPIKRYRRKPVVVEAIKYTGFNFDECAEFMSWRKSQSLQTSSLSVPNIPICIAGSMYALAGDYIVKGSKGEIYSCKPDTFEEMYEEVETDDQE